jgi:hypothetical protein
MGWNPDRWRREERSGASPPRRAPMARQGDFSGSCHLQRVLRGLRRRERRSYRSVVRSRLATARIGVRRERDASRTGFCLYNTLKLNLHLGRQVQVVILTLSVLAFVGQFVEGLILALHPHETSLVTTLPTSSSRPSSWRSPEPRRCSRASTCSFRRPGPPGPPPPDAAPIQPRGSLPETAGSSQVMNSSSAGRPSRALAMAPENAPASSPGFVTRAPNAPRARARSA